MNNTLHFVFMGLLWILLVSNINQLKWSVVFSLRHGLSSKIVFSPVLALKIKAEVLAYCVQLIIQELIYLFRTCVALICQWDDNGSFASEENDWWNEQRHLQVVFSCKMRPRGLNNYSPFDQFRRFVFYGRCVSVEFSVMKNKHVANKSCSPPPPPFNWLVGYSLSFVNSTVSAC
jgi:hypothetical protein